MNPPLHHYTDGTELILVHAFNPLAKTSQSILAISDRENISNDDSKRQAIDILNYPERIKERVSLSMSIIDPNGDKNDTWGHCGYIIQIPLTDIISTSPSDNGSRNSNSQVLIAEQQKNIQSKSILSPQELIDKTTSDYNEVLAFARNAKIVGCFIKIGLDGKPMDPELAKKVKENAQKLGVECREIKINSKESDSVADNFREIQVFTLSDSFFLGFVEGEGQSAIKYNIKIEKNGTLIESNNIHNWKMVSGAYKASELNITSNEKTLDILKNALKITTISEEQRSAVQNAIKNIEKPSEIVRESSLLGEGTIQNNIPSSSPNLKDKGSSCIPPFFKKLFRR